MNKQRIVGTFESVVQWLAESDATTDQEDLDLASALQILDRLPEGSFADSASDAEHRPTDEASDDRNMPERVFLEIALFLDRNGARVLDCTLETAGGDPVIAMEAEDCLAFAQVLYAPPGEKPRDVESLATRRASRRQMEEVALEFIASKGLWKPGPISIRFDVLQATVTGGSLMLSLRKGVWHSDCEPGFVNADTRERIAELVAAYRETGDCFEGCDIVDEIAGLIESELL